MLNNRQAGRRRGRGQQPRNNNNGGRESGNRVDNRARGNAPQMLEKYKNLARDSQLSGDRVMTEYYLQFADHYFRVVAENRARFEENRPPRQDWQDDEDGQENGYQRQGNEGDEGERSDEAPRQDRPERQPQRQYEAREPREDRQPREPREDREARAPRQDREPREAREPRPRPERRPAPRRDEGDFRAAANDAESTNEGTIDASVLPPAFVPSVMDASNEEEIAPRPRIRRPRKTAASEGAEAAE